MTLPCRVAPLLLCVLLLPGLGSAQVLLLGEVHDNPDGHQARYALLEQRVSAGWHPAIAMEQFDRERQADLDRASRECTDADCVIAMASGPKSSWTWEHYKPVITLALREHLPLRAANLSRADAGRIIKEGFAALGPSLVSAYALETAVPAAVLTPQVNEVRDGHCNQLPTGMLEPMANAQIARDIVMAETLRAHAADGVVLLAGNGHVRRDIGVPYWLRVHAIESHSIGFIEAPGSDAPFDALRVVRPFARPDPCANVHAPTAAAAAGVAPPT